MPGITLTDARALVPYIRTAEADPVADAEALAGLAEWSRRFTPLTAIDGTDGLVLDTTGCDHLFGGEAKLLAEIAARLTRAGIVVRLACACTPAAAWAWARFRPEPAPLILAGDDCREPLADLPVTALRLPEVLAADLCRVGLRRIRDLLDLPRAPLVTRYGAMVGRRLDQMFGAVPEPIDAQHPPAPWRSRVALAEPITRREDIEIGLGRLLRDLCRKLEEGSRGARRLELLLLRVDAVAQSVEIGTSRPSRDPKHLIRLFRERLDLIDPGFGIETMLLEAVATDPLQPRQTGLGGGEPDDAELTQLLDRLRARMGDAAIVRPTVQDTHLPERSAILPATEPEPAKAAPPNGTHRPILLLERPEPVEVAALVCGGLPIAFRWRGRRYAVGRLEGPERIEPEWWRDRRGIARDYYRAEDLEGQRFWLFRSARSGEADWYLHGLFA